MLLWPSGMAIVVSESQFAASASDGIEPSVLRSQNSCSRHCNEGRWTTGRFGLRAALRRCSGSRLNSTPEADFPNAEIVQLCRRVSTSPGQSAVESGRTHRARLTAPSSPMRTPFFCRVRSGGISRRFLASRGAASEADVGAVRSKERWRYD